MKTEKQINAKLKTLKKRFDVLRKNMKNSDNLNEENLILGQIASLLWVKKYKK